MNDRNNKKNTDRKKQVSKKIKDNKKDSNVIKLKTDFESTNLIKTKKLKAILVVSLIIFILLIVRIGFIQFVQGSYLKEQAYNQQTIN